MEYALLNKEETKLFLHFVWWSELPCRYWSVCVDILYTNTEILSRNPSFPSLFFVHSKLNVLMKTVDVMEKVFEVRMFKIGINVITYSLPNFLRCSERFGNGLLMEFVSNTFPDIVRSISPNAAS